MRLGVLEFAPVSGTAESVLDPLRARDVDVVPGDRVIGSMEEALREAGRLARADCDGVLLMAGEGLRPETVSAAATLLSGVPLLLAGHHSSTAFFNAVGTLEAIGARFDRVYLVNGEPDPVTYLEAWLQENGKKQRHRGLEAARKLYGQCMYVPQNSGGLPDAALWIHQFGIIATAEADGAEFAAPDGDACGALTEHLLTLVSGEPTVSVSVVLSPDGGFEVGENIATFARITRIRGRFRCLLLRGALSSSGSTVARFDCSLPQLFGAASFPLLHAVHGDHIGALRAACEALDIDAVLLRPG